jgi:hypothetical protein
LVIERELLILVDVTVGEDTYAYLAQHVPLHGDAVGLTGVVDESG